MPKKLTGNSAFIYNDGGSLIVVAKIGEHDSQRDIIEVADISALEIDTVYDVLIPTTPSPYTCRGKVSKNGSTKRIQLFKIKETENRRDVRYSVNFPADIENLIYEGQTYSMHRSVEVKLKNLSKNGIRFKSKYNALMTGDRFNLRLRIGDETDKLLTAHVVYRADMDRLSSEYGCRLISNAEVSYG
jgi:hypothetical protein